MVRGLGASQLVPTALTSKSHLLKFSLRVSGEISKVSLTADCLGSHTMILGEKAQSLPLQPQGWIPYACRLPVGG